MSEPANPLITASAKAINQVVEWAKSTIIACHIAPKIVLIRGIADLVK